MSLFTVSSLRSPSRVPTRCRLRAVCCWLADWLVGWWWNSEWLRPVSL